MKAIIDNQDLKIISFPTNTNKEIGVKASCPILKDELIVVYQGLLIENPQEYKNYTLFFRYKEKMFGISAEKDVKVPTNLAKLINHSKKNPNIKPIVLEYNNSPIVIFKAMRDIPVNEELLYDYGIRDKLTLQTNKWLMN